MAHAGALLKIPIAKGINVETNTHYTIVGAFVIILVSAFTMGVIWLSSGFSIQQDVTYILYMKDSVTGLSIDSAVELNGVKVGNVKQIELNHRNPQVVEVLLDIDKNAPITRGTVATLNTRGITGIGYVALKDRSTDRRPIPILKGQKYPIIKSAPSLLTRLDTTLSKIAKNFGEVSTSLQELLNKENQKSIHEALYNIKLITANLAENNARLNTILINTSKASQQFMPFVQASTNTMRIIESQTLPLTYRVLSNLNAMTQTIAELSMELKRNPSMIIRGVDHSSTGPGEK